MVSTSETFRLWAPLSLMAPMPGKRSPNSSCTSYKDSCFGNVLGDAMMLVKSKTWYTSLMNGSFLFRTRMRLVDSTMQPAFLSVEVSTSPAKRISSRPETSCELSGTSMAQLNQSLSLCVHFLLPMVALNFFLGSWKPMASSRPSQSTLAAAPLASAGLGTRGRWGMLISSPLWPSAKGSTAAWSLLAKYKPRFRLTVFSP
mmetsp:Transcript_95190/g.278288  ORF Transcript_95190/g.278288 Transcript_95190/m.278288 type:complete len:201 (-) Transcript_95190:78-680(-)